METLSLRPLCVSMNFMDCTNIPPDPQQESQRCLYWIQSNDSRDFEPPVFTSIGVVLIGYLLEQKCFFHEPVKVVFIFFSIKRRIKLLGQKHTSIFFTF